MQSPHFNPWSCLPGGWVQGHETFLHAQQHLARSLHRPIDTHSILAGWLLPSSDPGIASAYPQGWPPSKLWFHQWQGECTWSWPRTVAWIPPPKRTISPPSHPNNGIWDGSLPNTALTWDTTGFEFMPAHKPFLSHMLDHMVAPLGIKRRKSQPLCS